MIYIYICIIIIIIIIITTVSERLGPGSAGESGATESARPWKKLSGGDRKGDREGAVCRAALVAVQAFYPCLTQFWDFYGFGPVAFVGPWRRDRVRSPLEKASGVRGNHLSNLLV